jgi:excisionase family DNA binding protein
MSEPELITTTEAIELTGYNADYLRVLIRSNRIEARKYGRSWMIVKASLLEYVETVKKQQETDPRYGAKKPK